MVSLATKNECKVSYITVSAELAGQRLDNFLLNHLKGLPRTRVYRIVRKGEVRVNKGRVKPSYRLEAEDIVRVPPIQDLVSDRKSTIPSLPHRLKDKLAQAILYEDDALLILNKPSGLAVHGGSGLNFGAIEALRVLRPDCPSLELVHRLDRDTSGCLMFAKRRSMLRALHEMLREGSIQKVYWALVQGAWKKSKIVTIPLLKNQLSSGERIVRASTEALGQSATTRFRPLQQYYDPIAEMPMTLMEAKPITGRTHQIRVHATESGFPIGGDPKYGNEAFNRYLSQAKIGRMSRLFLHAQRLTFTLPGTDKILTIEAPLDTELSQCMIHFRTFNASSD